MTDVIEWRDVPGHPGFAASSAGDIRSPRGTVLKPWKSNKAGHVKVRLDDGRSEWVHRVVALTFHGPCPEGLEVRHLDGNPTNNRAENLRYGTHVENMQDRIAHGHVPLMYGDSCPRGHEYGPDRICWTCQFKAKKAWVRKNVGVYVDCDRCGRRVSKLNLTRHQRTARCHGGAR